MKSHTLEQPFVDEAIYDTVNTHRTGCRSGVNISCDFVKLDKKSHAGSDVLPSVMVI